MVKVSALALSKATSSTEPYELTTRATGHLETCTRTKCLALIRKQSTATTGPRNSHFETSCERTRNKLTRSIANKHLVLLAHPCEEDEVLTLRARPCLVITRESESVNDSILREHAEEMVALLFGEQRKLF